MPHTAVVPVSYKPPISESPHEVRLPDIPWLQRQTNLEPIKPHRQNASTRSPVTPPLEPSPTPRRSMSWADDSDHKYDVDDGFTTAKKTCKPPTVTRIQTEELAMQNPFSELAYVGASQDPPASSHQSAAPSSSSQAPEELKPKRKPASRTRKVKLASQPSE